MSILPLLIWIYLMLGYALCGKMLLDTRRPPDYSKGEWRRFITQWLMIWILFWPIVVTYKIWLFFTDEAKS